MLVRCPAVVEADWGFRALRDKGLLELPHRTITVANLIVRAAARYRCVSPLCFA